MIVDLIFSAALIVVAVWGIKYFAKKELEIEEIKARLIGKWIADAIISAVEDMKK